MGQICSRERLKSSLCAVRDVVLRRRAIPSKGNEEGEGRGRKGDWKGLEGGGGKWRVIGGGDMERMGVDEVLKGGGG